MCALAGFKLFDKMLLYYLSITFHLLQKYPSRDPIPLPDGVCSRALLKLITFTFPGQNV